MLSNGFVLIGSIWFNDGSKVLINGSTDRRSGQVRAWHLGDVCRRRQAGAGRCLTPRTGSLRLMALASLSPARMDRFVRCFPHRRRAAQIREWRRDQLPSPRSYGRPTEKESRSSESEYVPPAELRVRSNSFLASVTMNTTTNRLTLTPGNVTASAKNFIMESACGLRDGSVLFLRNTLEQPFIYHLWKLRTDPDTGNSWRSPGSIHSRRLRSQSRSPPRRTGSTWLQFAA